MINVIITGSKGKMGAKLISLVKKSPDLNLTAEVDKDESLEKYIDNADVVVDFTVAAAVVQNLNIAAKHKKPIVIGTTGLDDKQYSIVKESSKIIPIVFAPNMSIGVNVMWKIIGSAAKALGRDFKVDISETHHIHKLDKPSGTAKKMVDIVAKTSGRKADEISVSSTREGEVVGDHVIHFTSPGETLTIEHHAATREVFASGALVAAKWIVGKPAGLYGMDDVLNLSA